MKALLCKKYGPPESLVLEEVPSSKLGKHDVRIAVHAAGVNFPDLLIIQGLYQFKPEMPFAPGGEVAGKVLEVGEGVSHVKPGDRVMALTGWGGYAEEVVAPKTNVLPIPEKMDYVTAAGFTMVYGTSYHALVQRGRLKEGETLLVLGATGGVGLTAVELGKLMGAKVIAAGGSDEKLKVATEYGADHVINYNKESIRERVKALTNDQGADVIYDPVGGDAFDEAARSINWGGRLLVVGFASGRIPELAINRVLIKSCELVGVFWGAFAARDPKTNAANFAQLVKWYGEGKLKPRISKTYPLEKAADAMNALHKREVVGKVVLTVRAGD